MVQATGARQETRVLSCTSITRDDVQNSQGENLGKIKEIMIDVNKGTVSYAVLSFGGFMGLGDKLFAIPWSAMGIDQQSERIILDVPKEKLENAPGFDKDNWPDSADSAWLGQVYDYYGSERYW